jgi:hypothetical protein
MSLPAVMRTLRLENESTTARIDNSAIEQEILEGSTLRA